MWLSGLSKEIALQKSSLGIGDLSPLEILRIYKGAWGGSEDLETKHPRWMYAFILEGLYIDTGICNRYSQNPTTQSQV